MKIEWTRQNTLTVIFVGVALLVIIFLSLPSSKTDNTQALLNAQKKELSVQYEKQISDKQLLVNKGQADIKVLQSQAAQKQAALIISQEKYKVILSRYQELQKEKENVKPQPTNQALRNSFDLLGFPPLPIK